MIACQGFFVKDWLPPRIESLNVLSALFPFLQKAHLLSWLKPPNRALMLMLAFIPDADADPDLIPFSTSASAVSELSTLTTSAEPELAVSAQLFFLDRCALFEPLLLLATDPRRLLYFIAFLMATAVPLYSAFRTTPKEPAVVAVKKRTNVSDLFR